MYDTKTRELRWNATYFDYAASLPGDDVDHSECPLAPRGRAQGWARGRARARDPVALDALGQDFAWS